MYIIAAVSRGNTFLWGVGDQIQGAQSYQVHLGRIVLLRLSPVKSFLHAKPVLSMLMDHSIPGYAFMVVVLGRMGTQCSAGDQTWSLTCYIFYI